MPFVPIPNTAEVAIRCLQDGQNVANVWHVRYQGEPTPTIMTTIASTTITAWQDLVRGTTSSTVTLIEVSVVDQSEFGGFAALLAPSSNNTGTNASPPMPNPTTIAVKKNTGRAGRSFRGRLYHIGLCDNQIDANRLLPTAVTAISAAYNGFIARYTAINCEWVVASLYTANAPRVVGITTPITACSVDPVVDNQRRRAPGRGR